MDFCFDLQGQATSAMGLSRVAPAQYTISLYLHVLLLHLLSLSPLALKVLGQLFQISRVYSKSQFQLYFLMYLNTIALQYLILLGFILQLLLVV